MINRTKPIADFSSRIIVWGLSILLVLMPFHAFFSIYLGSIGLNQALVQSWKEVLIIILAFCWLLLCLSKQKLYIKFDVTNSLFIAIIVISLIVTLFARPSSSATLFGIKTNLVAIVVYLIAQIPIPNKEFIRKNIHWLVIAPGLVVAIFAILQSTIIPESFFRLLGYNASNINPQQIVDGSLVFHRAFSTLGGPNQLGNYLIVPLVFSLIYATKKKNWWMISFTVLFTLAIVLSFSRSAWLGAIVAITAGLLLIFTIRQRLIFMGVLVTMMVIGLIIFPTIVKSYPRLENIVFHGRYFENRIEGSDQARLDAITNATQAVMSNPIGHGLGSAGPASFKASQPVIPENWYLQIAYEVGILGLLLYILAFAGLLGDFIRNRNLALPASLFALTCGILVSNLFLHTWADSTLVLIVFTLYGLYKGQTA
jgi:O-antigen ligase